MTDVLDLADDIIEGCEDLLENFQTAIDISQTILANIIVQRQNWQESGSSINAPRVRLALITRTLIAMTQDVQIQLLPIRLNRLLRDLNFPPIRLAHNGFEIEATQDAPVTLEWPENSPYPTPQLTLRITLQLASQPAESVRLILPIEIAVIPETGELQFLLAGEPRFLQSSNGEAVDPLRAVPARTRGEARDRLRAVLRDALSVQRITLEGLGLNRLGISVTPIGYMTRRSLLIAGATKPGRRDHAGLPDDLGIMSFDQSVTLRDHIIAEKVRGELKRYKASLAHFTLARNRIEIVAHRTETHRECHVKVTVNVNIAYDIFIQEDLPANLFGSASWTRWSYKIKARRCYPVCDRVLEQAKQETVRRIEQVKFLTFAFADLRSVASRATVRTQPSGVTIFMKGK